MNKSVGRNIFLVCMALLALLLLVQCRAERKRQYYTELSGEIFHTFYRIKYDRSEDYSAAIDSTFSAFSRSLNPFDSTSLITAINRNRSTHTDSMLRHVWSAATRIAEATGGRYDVTCAPMISAWGFGFDSLHRVTPEVVDSMKQFVGYRGVRIVGEEMIKSDPRTQMDFSSISKGYCSDLIGQVLRQRGAENFLVELGGEIAFRGRNPQGEPWRIGVNKPIDDTTGVNTELELVVSLDREAGGLATSGNYRNYRIVDGRKVAHTINPLTGYPIQTDVLSATILSTSCMLADGLATACMTLPSAEVPNLIAQFPGTEYLLILGDESTGGFRTLMSAGFRALVVE